MEKIVHPTFAFCLLPLALVTHGHAQSTYMTKADQVAAKIMANRESDWRNGAVVYQVFVDRFAPSANLKQKLNLYAPPRSLHPWSEVPVSGHPDPTLGIWTHELAFWGGDLKSVRGKLDYIQSLGADVVYLNPIQIALTNHKYDALDWAKVAPEYGTRQGVADLAQALHARGMKLMLDGVFNHMGKNAPRFVSAMKDPKSEYRDWFFIGPQYPDGYRAWANVTNLPEVRLENPAVQRTIWASKDSVVQKYLTEGVDGWRLDTAYELGRKYLGELTEAAHRAKPGSEVVGEVWNYPQGWMPAMDGVMNFFARGVVFDSLAGKLSASRANRLLAQMVADTGIEPLLKSWFILDNHDTDRLKSAIPDIRQRHLAQVLQFTLPGSPVVYYGTELGMEGAGDPGSRGPMRWDLVGPQNTELQWTKSLISMRKTHRALRIGDFRSIDSEHLIAFTRNTDRALDTVVVLANPSNETVRETISCRESRLMNGGELTDLLSGSSVRCFSGLFDATIPARSVRVYSLVSPKGYTPYKRTY